MAGLVVDWAARTITGLAVPYDRATLNAQRRYRFLPGWAVYDQVPLLVDHDQSQRVGRALEVTDTPAGFHVVLRVNRGARGDRLLGLVDDETLGLSAGVVHRRLLRDPNDPQVLLVAQGDLSDISLTDRPAFDTR